MRNIRSTRVTLLLALLLATSLLSLVPRSAEAELRCGPTQQTPRTWGMGPTCFDAYNDLYNRADQYVSCPWLGVCEQYLVQDSPCYDADGGKKIDGYMVYSCTFNYCGNHVCPI